MEAIVVFSLLTSLVVASVLWGHDSRKTIRSKEQELASYGVSWNDLAIIESRPSWPVIVPAEYAVGHLNGVGAPLEAPVPWG